MSDVPRHAQATLPAGSLAETVRAPAVASERGGLPEVGGFRIERKLGQGAMGEVYLARGEDGLPVALKLMAPQMLDRPDLLLRFEREAQLLLRLRHPNIAGAVAHGASGERRWLAMEYVDGPTLTALQRTVGVFAEIDVLRLVRQIAQALGYAWQEVGLVHRDIKPGNLLVVPDPAIEGGETIKIIDFGLARANSGAEDLGLTMTGMAMGTPNYMAPEQIRGDRDLGPQADMYAIGCTMHHLLTGHLPFERPSPAEVLSAHLNDAPPDPGALAPAISSPTRHLAMTLMAKDPAKRYARYEEIVAFCDQVLRTLELRDTTGVKLLRRPLVLSRPRLRPKPIDNGTIADPFAYETARVRRSAKDPGSGSGSGSDYAPGTDRTPGPVRVGEPPTTKTHRKATDALIRAATDRHRRATATHRRTPSSTPGALDLRTPELPPRPTELPPVPEAPHDRHVAAWISVAISLAALAGALFYVL